MVACFAKALLWFSDDVTANDPAVGLLKSIVSELGFANDIMMAVLEDSCVRTA